MITYTCDYCHRQIERTTYHEVITLSKGREKWKHFCREDCFILGMYGKAVQVIMEPIEDEEPITWYGLELRLIESATMTYAFSARKIFQSLGMWLPFNILGMENGPMIESI